MHEQAPLGELMLHPSSPLISFYPPDFTSDANGKRQAWEAVVEIPFIEAGILLDTVEQILEKDDSGSDNQLLTPAERRRNMRGKSHLFVPPGFAVNGDTGKSKSGSTPRGAIKEKVLRDTPSPAKKKRASPKKGVKAKKKVAKKSAKVE